VVGGKPLFSGFFAFPVSYELTILLGAFGSLIGMFVLNRLPRHHHPLLANERFADVTDDKFYVVIECEDDRYEEQATRALLENTHAVHIEMVEDAQ
jgi:alpha/beta superfamily hydrolase